MATITIDGKQYSVEAGKNLLEVCLSAGIDLPYFCWHPAMGSVGACRQCAAKQFSDSEDERGRLVTACMTPVQDGNIFSVVDPQAHEFRAMVIESLMTNHPHDCPVCEEGGECHLQDMTEMSGHTSRRYRGKKRTHTNQNLGPLINHEMNRCITCYRCVRFYDDYAGGHDLVAQASANHVYFGREKDGVLESEFSGNLVEVCPTGVFTDKTFSAHYSRKWDLQTAPSVCSHCAVGCNTTPGARYESIRRVVNRYHSEINGYFLCDRGRYGYAYNNHPDRLSQVQMLRENNDDSSERVVAAAQDGLDRLLQAAEGAGAGDTFVVGIGSPRSSMENNYALREFVSAENFYLGVSSADYASHGQLAQCLGANGLDIATVKQAEQADAIIVLGEDIAETAPIMSLALRQAVRNKGIRASADAGIAQWQDAAVRRYSAGDKTPLFIASLTATRLDDAATSTLQLDPQRIAQLGFYLADHIAGRPSEVQLNDAEQRWANAVALVLAEAKKPLVVSGSGYQQPALMEASINIFNALKARRSGARYYYALPEVNSLGLALLTADRKNHNLLTLWEQLRAAKKHGMRTVMVVMENDLYRRMGANSVEQLLEEVDELLVMDHISHGTTQSASCCLPVSTAFESQGTLVSAEGRAQRFFSVLAAPVDVRHSWRWFVDAAQQIDDSETGVYAANLQRLRSWQHCDDITKAVARDMPELSALLELIPAQNRPLRRQSHRYSGRTAMNADKSVAEKKPVQDMDSDFTYSMEGFAAHGSFENSVWSPGWNSNQAIHKFQQEVAGPLIEGESGRRLFEYNRADALSDFQTRMHKESVSTGNWMQIYPVPLVFGSEELSARADAIAELSPKPALLLNPQDADKLQVKEWDTLQCNVAEHSHQLYVRIDSTVPVGLACACQLAKQEQPPLISSHWPVSVELVKDASPLPKPNTPIATDWEPDYVQ